MNQKLCLITGANTGIGKAAAIQIVQQRHHVIMACRDREKGEAALRDLREQSESGSAELMIVDMSLQSSINDLSEALLDKYDRLDVLIHNAAIFDITQKQASRTDEDIERVWATNHLGPVLLTELMWRALNNSAQGRVITIASKGLIVKPFLRVDLDDPEYRRKPFSMENSYYQSKLAQIIFTHWLSKRGSKTRITANCIRVPAVRINIDKYRGLSVMQKKAYALKSKLALSPEQMANAYTFLATAAEMEGVTGLYYNEKMKPVKPPRYTEQSQNINKVMELTMSYLGRWLKA